MTFSSTLRASLIVSALAASAANAHWIFGGTRPIITERLDSIVDAGQVRIVLLH